MKTGNAAPPKQFGFVILNFRNFEETIECVESILRISSDDYHIAIVDNDSPNESFRVLAEKYSSFENIEVIQSGKNGGYSAGNNCGIRFLESLGIKNFIIATSDTIVVSKDILQQLKEIDLDHVGVVGPRIRTPQGEDQNPLERRVGLNYVLNIHFPSITSFFRNGLYSLVPRLKSFVRDRKDYVRKTAPSESVFMVHGSFLLLTSAYIANCGLLDESIFMYGEEDLLAYSCRKNSLKTLYIPSIEIIHKDAKSTPKEHNNSFTTLHSSKSMVYLRKKIRLATLLSYSIQDFVHHV